MSKPPDLETIERSIVLELLRDDHPERWTRAELERATSVAKPEVLDRTVERLQEAGVIDSEGEQFWATPGTRYLDALGMVCI